MLYNIKPLLLHRVFHGIRFKVNKDWVSGIDTLLFLYLSKERFFSIKIVHFLFFLYFCRSK